MYISVLGIALRCHYPLVKTVLSNIGAKLWYAVSVLWSVTKMWTRHTMRYLGERRSVALEKRRDRLIRIKERKVEVAKQREAELRAIRSRREKTTPR